MSIIRRLLPTKDTEQRGVLLPPGFNSPPITTYSGQSVTPESAARSAAVTACQRVLSSSVASLPVDAFRTVGKVKQQLDPAPSLVRSPSGLVRRRFWVSQIMKSLVGPGNSYGLVTNSDVRGFPVNVETIHYRDVTWMETPQGLKPHLKGVLHELWPLGDFVHIPASAFAQPGTPVADSPVELAKQAIGTGLAAEEFGARFFGDGYHPTALAKSTQELTKEQAEGIKAAINRMRHNREPGVFGAGLEVEFPEVNPEDSQFIDLMRFEVEQACRFFGVPPSMVYAAVSGQNVTYANVSQADLQFLKHSLRIWLHDVEDAWSSMLPGPQYVKFNVDALLEVDAPLRHEIHERRLKSKTTTINEVRTLEDEEPFDDPVYDEPGIPGGFDPADETEEGP